MTMRSFGIEIELVGTTIEKVEEAFNDAGILVVSQDYNHRTAKTWKIVPDSSLTPGGFEVVSPILKGEDGIMLVRKVADLLVGAGAKVDNSCGFHVHVGTQGMTIKSIVNVAHRYNKFENDINKFMPMSRRDSRYCHSMENLFSNNSVESILRGGTRSLGNLDRYHKVNLAAFARHGTVEFRQHSGTLSALKMENWIRFCLGFVEASILSEEAEKPPISHSEASPISTYRFSNEKLTRLYNQFQRLGIGNTIPIEDLTTNYEMTEGELFNSLNKISTETGCRFRVRYGFARMSFDPQQSERRAKEREVQKFNFILPEFHNDSLFRGIESVESFYKTRTAQFEALYNTMEPSEVG